MDGIAELASKKRVPVLYIRYIYIMELAIIWPKLSFLEGKGFLSCKNKLYHPYVTSQTLLSSSQIMGACLSSRQSSRQSQQKNGITCYLPKTDFSLSADVLFCKFRRQNVDWKGVDMYKDHLDPKSVWKNNQSGGHKHLPSLL